MHRLYAFSNTYQLHVKHITLLMELLTFFDEKLATAYTMIKKTGKIAMKHSSLH